MRIAFAILIGIHGLIHLLGPAKAFGWAEVQPLRTPISPFGGALWLVAAILLVGAAIGFALSAQWWGWFGLPGMVLSQVLITQSWSDAKFGTIANLAIAVPLVLLGDWTPVRPASARVSRTIAMRCWRALCVRRRWSRRRILRACRR